MVKSCQIYGNDRGKKKTFSISYIYSTRQSIVHKTNQDTVYDQYGIHGENRKNTKQEYITVQIIGQCDNDKLLYQPSMYISIGPATLWLIWGIGHDMKHAIS